MPALGVLLLLSALATTMAVSTAVFVRWAAGCRTALRASIVLFLLLMMAGMLAGALVYELWPSRQSAVAGLWLASVVMSASVAVVFAAFLQEVRRLAGARASTNASGWLRGLAPAVVVLVLVSETLMGWTFGVAAGSVPRFASTGVAGSLAQFGRIVVSPWFTFPMVVEMGLSLVWLRRGLSAPVARLLAFQPVVMLCSPPSLPGIGWEVGTAIGSSAAMTAAIVYLLLLGLRGSEVSRRFRVYAAGLLVSFVLMGSGLALWAVAGSLTVFSVAIVAQMTVFMGAVIVPDPALPTAADGLAVPVVQADAGRLVEG